LSAGDIIKSVTGRSRDRRAFFSVAFYALFLFTSQFGHHDLLCHLKTPQHCTACTSSIVGDDTEVPSTPGAAHLVDAGRTAGFELPAVGVLLPVRTTGRSPPAFL
jgi:hypothetical protein